MVSLALAGCIQVGPDYTPPEPPLAPEWGSDDQRIETGPPDDAAWWRTLNDPVLSALIEMAPAQNPTVQIAGVRVLQARAQLGAAIGELYPQQQQATGEVRYEKLSDRDSSSALLREVQQDVGNRGNLPSLDDRSFWITEFGIDAAWELDLWGKFRRGIESADEELLASVASYDDVLVSLIAEVASTYVSIRMLRGAPRLARENAQSQDASRSPRPRCASAWRHQRDRRPAGRRPCPDPEQDPAVSDRSSQNQNTLSVLLGMPPADLGDLLSRQRDSGRRRPWSRSPFRRSCCAGGPTSAATSAGRRPVARDRRREGAALPRVLAERQLRLRLELHDGGEFFDAFKWSSRTASFGPAVSWNRSTTARSPTGPRAGRELPGAGPVLAEHGAGGAAGGRERARRLLLGAGKRRPLAEAVAAGERGRHLADPVPRRCDRLHDRPERAAEHLRGPARLTQGNVTLSLIALYRALGGGWQIRIGARTSCRDDTRRRWAGAPTGAACSRTRAGRGRGDYRAPCRCPRSRQRRGSPSLSARRRWFWALGRTSSRARHNGKAASVPTAPRDAALPGCARTTIRGAPAAGRHGGAAGRARR